MVENYIDELLVSPTTAARKGLNILPTYRFKLITSDILAAKYFLNPVGENYTDRYNVNKIYNPKDYLKRFNPIDYLMKGDSRPLKYIQNKKYDSKYKGANNVYATYNL